MARCTCAVAHDVVRLSIVWRGTCMGRGMVLKPSVQASCAWCTSKRAGQLRLAHFKVYRPAMLGALQSVQASCAWCASKYAGQLCLLLHFSTLGEAGCGTGVLGAMHGAR